MNTNNNKLILKEKEIITEIKNREIYMELIKKNPGLLVIKLTASWCIPCQQIKNDVYTFFSESPNYVICADIDIDKNHDVQSFLKNKKIFNKLPTILCYIQGNKHYAPDDFYIGSNIIELRTFFKNIVQKARRRIDELYQSSDNDNNDTMTIL